MAEVQTKAGRSGASATVPTIAKAMGILTNAQKLLYQAYQAANTKEEGDAITSVMQVISDEIAAFATSDIAADRAAPADGNPGAPKPCQRPLLTDPGLVLEPDLDRLVAGVRGERPGDELTRLYASCATASFCG